jgi:hypothetical protein
MAIRCPATIGVLLVLAAAAGCGQSGPTRYHLSGKVVFQGQPVPEGTISFEPLQGDAGGGFAFIRSGRYDTAGDGRGHLGGEHRVRITGTTGKPVRPGDPDSGSADLFSPYETTADLSAKLSSLDFEVPADGGRLTTQ